MISEVVQVTQRLPTETNHQGNPRLLLVRNASVEAENKITTIKAAVQTAGGILNYKTFMSMPGGSPSIKMAGLISSFKYEENNYMSAETIEEHELAYAEAAYENPGKQEPMGFMELCREIQGSENEPPRWTVNVHFLPT